MKKISVTLPNSAKKATFKVRNSVKTKIKKKKSGDGFSNLENKGYDGHDFDGKSSVHGSHSIIDGASSIHGRSSLHGTHSIVNERSGEVVFTRAVSAPDGKSMVSMGQHSNDNNSKVSLNSLDVPIIGEGLKPGMDIQPHMTAALAVMDTLATDAAVSPSLRRISIRTDETPKVEHRRLSFRKSKPNEPTQTLVFSFSKNDTDGLADLLKKSGFQDKIPTSIVNETEQIKVVDKHEGVDTDDPVPFRTFPDYNSPPGVIITSQDPDPDGFLDKKEDSNAGSSGYKSLQVMDSLDKVETTSVRSYRTNPQISLVSQHQETEAKIQSRQHFWDFFTMVISLLWGIFIFFGALVIYIYDILLREEDHDELSPIFNVTMTTIGIATMFYFIVDIKLYISKLEKRAYGNLELGDLKLVEGEDGDWHVELPMPGEKKLLPEYYGFVSGRHAGSFFLKIGAGFFCTFHLVHLLVNLIKTITFSNFGKDETLYDICQAKTNFAYEILIILYVMLQFYVIFKFGNVIVNKNRSLARFAFMHCLATSLSFWAYTLVNETVDVLVKKKFYYEDCEEGDYDGGHYYGGELHPLYNCTNIGTFECTLEKRYFCVSSNKMADGLFGVTTFLYPFSIEFNILVVGIWYILWSNIGNIHDHKESLSFLPSVTPKGSMEVLHKSENRKEAMVIFADCKSSITGLILGTLVFILTIVTAILIFVFEGSCDDNLLYISDDISYTLESCLLGLMIGVSCYVYYKLASFQVNPDPISFLDDLLLLICIPTFVIYFLITLIPNFVYKFDVNSFITNILTIIQVFVQTPLIIDGLRRCSKDAETQRRLKGRNSLMLLIILNLALYLLETVNVSSKTNQKNYKSFYGLEGWTVLSHATLPLCIFFRFHSSVALVDIWNSAYKPPEHSHH